VVGCFRDRANLRLPGGGTAEPRANRQDATNVCWRPVEAKVTSSTLCCGARGPAATRESSLSHGSSAAACLAVCIKAYQAGHPDELSLSRTQGDADQAFHDARKHVQKEASKHSPARATRADIRMEKGGFGKQARHCRCRLKHSNARAANRLVIFFFFTYFVARLTVLAWQRAATWSAAGTFFLFFFSFFELPMSCCRDFLFCRDATLADATSW